MTWATAMYEFGNDDSLLTPCWRREVERIINEEKKYHAEVLRGDYGVVRWTVTHGVRLLWSIMIRICIACAYLWMMVRFVMSWVVCLVIVFSVLIYVSQFYLSVTTALSAALVVCT